MIVSELWDYQHNEPIFGIELGDINGDGATEIIAYTNDGKILILSLKGVLLFEDQVSEKGPIYNVKIFDIDKDGKNELMVGGHDGLLKVFKWNSKTNKLEPFWAHQFGASISGILVEDLNYDNNYDILSYSLDKSIRAINSLNGELIWGQIFADGIGDAILWRNDELAMREILACGNDGTIRMYDGRDGKLLWSEDFTNKIRFISFILSNKAPIIVCGGDDKMLHFFDKNKKSKIKSLEFNDYLWKGISYPSNINNKALISSYSFAHLEESIPIEDIKFTSKLICIDEDLETRWELVGKNIEYMEVLEKQESIYILLGTTSGELIIIDEKTGRIIFKMTKNSCINMVKNLTGKNILITCHDNGEIYAFFLEDY